MTTIASATTAQAATRTTATAASAADSAATKIAGDMQNFLQLLTTQLRNQDPTSPMDANQFTGQLAQFAAVEQSIAVNKHMEGLLNLQRASAMLSAAPLLGQQVEVTSDRVALAGGVAQEMRLPALSAADGASRARILVQDAAGTTLRETILPLGREASSWSWDGKDARGRALADGVYKVVVTGVDAAGGSTGAVPFTVAGAVTGIGRDGEEPTLNLGRLQVELPALRGLR